ncbi:MAG: biotin--[acetyl-CoA-carboxylase] ligase [Candidatus Nanopelagicales bacterium]
MLRNLLAPISGLKRIWFFEEIASTQTFLEREENLTVGDLVVARHQTKGRGRLSRTWSDESGGSILFSIALPVSDVLTLAVGVGVIRALKALSPALSLKWPNDIVLEDVAGFKKVGGIITTKVNDDIAIAGVGINVIAPQDEQRALGLADLIEGNLDVATIIKSIIDEVITLSKQDATEILRQFRDYTSTLNRSVRIQAINGKSIFGKVVDIANDGALILETDNGPIRIISGEVEYVRHS